MTNATTTQIQAMIETYITKQNMFTAYDVTKGLRSQDLHVMHSDVKSVLDKYNWRNRYTRTINKTVAAYVHHDPMVNPDNYDANAIPEVSITKVSNSTSYGTMGKSGVVGQTGTVGASTLLDKRGRFTISRNFIRDAGFVPFTYVNFEVTSNAIIIRKVINSNDKHATVDSKFNIRIPRSVFTQVFTSSDSDKDLKIATSRNTITVYR
jgi:hypothetical protein